MMWLKKKIDRLMQEALEKRGFNDEVYLSLKMIRRIKKWKNKQIKKMELKDINLRKIIKEWNMLSYHNVQKGVDSKLFFTCEDGQDIELAEFNGKIDNVICEIWNRDRIDEHMKKFKRNDVTRWYHDSSLRFYILKPLDIGMVSQKNHTVFSSIYNGKKTVLKPTGVYDLNKFFDTVLIYKNYILEPIQTHTNGLQRTHKNYTINVMKATDIPLYDKIKKVLNHNLNIDIHQAK